MLITTVAVGAAGAWGIVRAADARADDVERVEGLDGVLADGSTGDVETVTSEVDTDGDGIPDMDCTIGWVQMTTHH